MGWKRRAMISLALGAVTTVAVAWWPTIARLRGRAAPFALRSTSVSDTTARRAPNALPSYRSLHVWTIRRTTDPLTTNVRISADLADFDIASSEHVARFAALGPELGDLVAELRLDRGQFVPGATGLLASATPDERRGWIEWHAAGWPLRALRFRREWDSSEDDRFSFPGGFLLRRSAMPSFIDRKPQPVVLPLHPLLLGVVVNTLLAAAPAFGLAWLVVSVRRARRKLHGYCPICGYDRRGLHGETPCPECGKQCTETNPGTPHSPDPALPARQF